MELKLLESELQKLSAKEKGAIIYKLMDSLDNGESKDFEKVWIEEAERRHKQMKVSDNPGIDSDLVIKEAKSKYK